MITNLCLHYEPHLLRYCPQMLYMCVNYCVIFSSHIYSGSIGGCAMSVDGHDSPGSGSHAQGDNFTSLPFLVSVMPKL